MLFAKTEAGRTEVQARTRPLTPAQRQVLILLDGERHMEDVVQMLPAGAAAPALEHLVREGLVSLRDAAPLERPVEAAPLSEAERYRAVVGLATSMVSELGFTARIRAQLQIEKAQSLQDLSGVVELLCTHLKSTPLMTLRLNKLRQLAAH
ncbi:MAG: hypothetical protein ACAH21_09070 [Ramlibacter sp.]